MTFLQPVFLWGLLAIAIPVLIHLWHQKRGQPLPWAAMQWIQEASEQQQRGFKFDDWLLLLVRCLVLALLAVLLAKPVWKQDTDPLGREVVHLVAADSLVTAAFRFEQNQARKKGESVIPISASVAANPLQLQLLLDSLRRPGRFLHLYLRAEAALADVPQLSVPAAFSLHTVRIPQPKPSTPETALKTFSTLKRPLVVWLNYQDPRERQTVRAALRALATVYALDLRLTDGPVPSVKPDWVLTDLLPDNRQPATLYTVSGGRQFTQGLRTAQTSTNVVYTPDTLTPQTSERVAGGRLSEWLGNQLLRFYKRNTPLGALTQQELAGLFVPTTPPDGPEDATTSRTKEQNWLLLAFILLMGMERWLALRK